MNDCRVCGSSIRPIITRPDRSLCDLCELAHDEWVNAKVRAAVEESKWTPPITKGGKKR